MKKGLYEFMDYFPFMLEIVKRDFKKKYYRSVLGVAWTVLSPLLMMLVVTLIFSTIFSRHIEHYPAYWLSGNMLYSLLMGGAETVMGSISGNAPLIKKKQIPKYLFCITSLTQRFINTLFALIPFFAVSLVIGVRFNLCALLIPIPLILSYLFTLGFGMFLASYGTFFKDMHYLFRVVKRLFLYLTPIFYPISIIPSSYRFFWDLNPLCVYITMFRDLTIYGTMPTEKYVIIGTVYAILMLGLGIVTFKEKEDRFFLYI